eukprot:7311470-Prorocentrum_lima.AAC.1
MTFSTTGGREVLQEVGGSNGASADTDKAVSKWFNKLGTTGLSRANPTCTGALHTLRDLHRSS